MSEPSAITLQTPTILFIHGAWDNGSAWDKVRTTLSHHGYLNIAPSLSSAGGVPPVPRHIVDSKSIHQELTRLFHEGRKELVVVSHSYGELVLIESLKGF